MLTTYPLRDSTFSPYGDKRNRTRMPLGPKWRDTIYDPIIFTAKSTGCVTVRGRRYFCPARSLATGAVRSICDKPVFFVRWLIVITHYATVIVHYSGSYLTLIRLFNHLGLLYWRRFSTEFDCSKIDPSRLIAGWVISQLCDCSAFRFCNFFCILLLDDCQMKSLMKTCTFRLHFLLSKFLFENWQVKYANLIDHYCAV